LSTPTAQFVCKQGGDDPPCQLSSQIASNSFLSYDNKTNPYNAPFSNPNRPTATFVPNAWR